MENLANTRYFGGMADFWEAFFEKEKKRMRGKCKSVAQKYLMLKDLWRRYLDGNFTQSFKVLIQFCRHLAWNLRRESEIAWTACAVFY